VFSFTYRIDTSKTYHKCFRAVDSQRSAANAENDLERLERLHKDWRCNVVTGKKAQK